MKRLFPFAFGLFFTACVSPYSISKMKPLATETTWIWGREFASQTIDGVTVKVAFENNDYNTGVFNVEVVNNSDQEVLISPEKFQVQISGRELPKHFVRLQPARDPESYFLKLEKQVAQQQADETNTAILHATSLVTEAAVNVASLAIKETPEEKDQRHAIQDEADYNRQVDNYNLEVNRLNLNDQKQYYYNTLLRKTTLPPNSVMSGQVHFPRHPKASQFEIIIPVNDQILKFPFSHSLVKP